MHGFPRPSLEAIVILLVPAFSLCTFETAAQQQPTISGQAITQSGNVLAAEPGNVTAMAEEIDQLPKGRSFQSIVLLAPSVNAGELEGGWQINGASGAENAVIVDGINTSSVINGASRQNTMFEYIDEIRVRTSGFTAEEGGALGGVVNVVTKSGGNRFAGEAHYYRGGSVLAAGPVKRLVVNPADDNAVRYVQDDEQQEVNFDFGMTFGGPVVRDALFFFGAVLPRINRTTNEYRFSSGRDEGQMKRESMALQTFGKLNLSRRRLNSYVAVLVTPAHVVGSLPGYNGYGANWTSASKAAGEASIHHGSKVMQVSTTARADIVIANSGLATIRTGLFHDRYSDTGIPKTTSYTYQAVAAPALGIPSNLQGPVGVQNAPRALITNFDTTKRIAINIDYAHTVNRAGRHTAKGGLGYQHTHNRVDSSYPGGYVDIFWGRAAVFPGRDPDRGQYGFYTVTNRGLIGDAGADIVSLYIQDRWQLGRRLALNLGVRAEREKVPAYNTEVQDLVFDFPFGRRVAPRISLTYDPAGNGAAKFYANWGRYVDWTKYAIARRSFGGDTWCTYYRAIDNPDDPLSANLANMPGRDLWTTGGSCRNFLVPKFDTIDPDVRPMSQDRIIVGIELEVTSRILAAIRYVHNSLNRTIEDVFALRNGEVAYLITNPGLANSRLMPSLAAPLTGGGSFSMPKANRQYDALEFGMSRRFANNWFGSANVTISRLYGNYAGLASSDDIRTPTTGVAFATAQRQAGSIFREGGNLNRGWDLDDAMFDSHGNLDVRGRLATDRPIVAKFYGAANVARNTQIGAFVYVGSGTPISTYVNTVNQTEVFVEGRGDMGRTPVFSKTDLLVSHELPAAGNTRVRVELNVLNLFNQKTARHIFNYLNRGAGVPRASSAIDLHDVDLFKGYDYSALIRATPDGADAYDPRYGMPDLFETGTQGQVSVKFLF